MENLSSVVKIHIRITNINMNSRSAAHYMIKLFCCYNSAFTRKRSDSHKPLCNSQRKPLTWQVIWTLGWNAATLSQTQFASCECHLSAQSHSLQKSACPEKKERNRARCSVTNDGTNDLLSSKCVSTVFKVMVIVMMCMCYFFLNHRLFCCLPVWDLMTHPAQSSLKQSQSICNILISLANFEPLGIRHH